jgi:putative endonuclease
VVELVDTHVSGACVARHEGSSPFFGTRGLYASGGLFCFSLRPVMYYVYAISSTSRNYIYVGMTDHVERRFAQHNNGWNSTTKPYTPFELIHVEEFLTRSDARKKEKYLKSGAGKELLKKIRDRKT